MPVEIHGKQYVTVNERIQMFHAIYPNGAIQTKIETSPEGMWIIKATICPDVDVPHRIYEGTACEIIGSSQINKTSALENCETSAIGRSLGFLGLGIIDSIATADEVHNAQYQQQYKPKSQKQKDKFKEYITHSYFQKLDADGVPLAEATKVWWRGLTTEPAAQSGLTTMEGHIKKHDEKLEKQRQNRIKKNENK